MTTRHLSLITSAALTGIFLCASALIVQTASAEEVSGSVNVSASASTTRTRPAPKPAPTARPMPIKEQVKERMENIRDAQQAQEKRAVVAANASTTLRARVDAKIEERKEAIAQKLEATRMKVLSRFGTEALNQFKRVDDRLSDALSRLADVSARIDSRIAKLKAENIDMTTAESLNVTAKTKLTDAQAKVSAIVIPTLPTSASTTKDQINASLKSAREQVKAAEIAIRAAREAFMKVVAEIKSKGGERAEVETQVSADASVSN